jgi:hypothetical protein
MYVQCVRVCTYERAHTNSLSHKHTHARTHTQLFDDPEEEAALYAKVEQTQQQQPPLHCPQQQQQQQQPPELPQSPPPQQPQPAAEATAPDTLAPPHAAPSSAANAAMQQPPQPLAAAAGGVGDSRGGCERHIGADAPQASKTSSPAPLHPGGKDQVQCMGQGTGKETAERDKEEEEKDTAVPEKTLVYDATGTERTLAFNDRGAGRGEMLAYDVAIGDSGDKTLAYDAECVCGGEMAEEEGGEESGKRSREKALQSGKSSPQVCQCVSVCVDVSACICMHAGLHICSYVCVCIHARRRLDAEAATTPEWARVRS